MPRQYLCERTKRVRQRLDKVHRAVLAARATYRHGEITAIVTPVGRQPGVHKAPDIFEHALRFRILLHELDHRDVLPGQRAQ